MPTDKERGQSAVEYLLLLSLVLIGVLVLLYALAPVLTANPGVGIFRSDGSSKPLFSGF